MSQFTNGAFSFVTSGPTLETIRVATMGFPTNAQISVDDSDSVWDQAMSLVGWAPEFTCTTKAIENVLANIAISGSCVGSAFTQIYSRIYARKLATCQAALSGTPHMQWQVNGGLLRLGALSASRGADATISFILDALSVGGAAPVAETDGVAIPTATGGRFRLGVCKIAGVTFNEIEDVSINFNVSITSKEPQMGGIYPEAVGVLNVQPELMVTGRDISKIKAAALAMGANAATHANTVIQLKKLEDSGSYYGDMENEHIQITMAGMAFAEDLVNASTGGRATNGIKLRSLHDTMKIPVFVTPNTTYSDTP